MFTRPAASAAAASLAALAASAPLHAAPLSDVYTGLAVLGDSLSDTGNLLEAVGLPESPPYFEGRFSDGPVYADLLAEGFAPGAAVNLAFGGARAVPNAATGDDEDLIPDLPEQLGLLSAVPQAAFGDASLALVLFGGNDGFAAVGEPDQEARMLGAAAAVVDGARALADRGFSEVAVLSLPDLAPTPLYTFAQPDLQDEAAEATATYNAALGAGVAGLAAEGAPVTLIDTVAIFDAILADAGAFGITDLSGAPCLPLGFDPDEFDAVPDCEGTFFDAVHPTALVHAAVAGFVEDALTTPGPAVIPLPAGLPLLAAGLGALGLARRRRAGGRLSGASV